MCRVTSKWFWKVSFPHNGIIKQSPHINKLIGRIQSIKLKRAAVWGPILVSEVRNVKADQIVVIYNASELFWAGAIGLCGLNQRPVHTTTSKTLSLEAELPFSLSSQSGKSILEGGFRCTQLYTKVQQLLITYFGSVRVVSYDFFSLKKGNIRFPAITIIIYWSKT